MAYEKKTWVCGETITADGLNNIENGIEDALDCCGRLPEVTTDDDGDVLTVVDGSWEKAEPGYSCSEGAILILEESVTTINDGNYAAGFLQTAVSGYDSIIVTVDGTEYTCAKDASGNYGAPFDDATFTYDWSDYPFAIAWSNSFRTQTVGTYSVKVEIIGEIIDASECFEKAVKYFGLKNVADATNGGVIEGNIQKHIPQQYRNVASGFNAHAEGGFYLDQGWGASYYPTVASGDSSHAEGMNTEASGYCAHAEGLLTKASNYESHAEGYDTKASGETSHAEGKGTVASGKYSHAEGEGATASGMYSHAEGWQTTASKGCSHAEGWRTTASGNDGSHAEGWETTASASCSHAEGRATRAEDSYTHAEGWTTTASGDAAHSEGSYTISSGGGSHAEGWTTTASGDAAHAEGYGTTANHKSQHVFGEYNIEDPSTATANLRGNYVEIVGNGTGTSARSNARTLDWNGNETLAGSLTLGNTTLTEAQLIQLLALISPTP